jgi:membrane protein
VNAARAILGLLRAAYAAWVLERRTLLAAALAYFGFFSLAPLIYMAFAVAEVFIDTSSTAERMYALLGGFLGADAAGTVQGMVLAVSSPSGGGPPLAIVVSILAVLWAASGLFVNLQNALNSIWGVPLPAERASVLILRQRLLAVVLVVAAGLAIVALAALSLALSWIAQWLPAAASVALLGPLLAGLLLAGLLALIYRYIPQTSVDWKDVWLGAALTSGVITLAAVLVGLFLRSGILGSPLGAAGAFVVILVAMYYTAYAFLLGAVFTREFAMRFGSRQDGPEGQDV